MSSRITILSTELPGKINTPNFGIYIASRISNDKGMYSTDTELCAKMDCCFLLQLIGAFENISPFQVTDFINGSSRSQSESQFPKTILSSPF